ncbi:GRAM domain-containing protein 4 [Labeo rohita]|uniref:GRAM domain-containing protein 4 n=1 Tax=Labeo rohita TaxID=84645 RepID=A0ABQ8LCA2_LABRO|nr:GRAM domain-containing protein 4 [Labeo rohita]
MSRNDCEDHGASTSDPHTVENRVLRRTSPTSADLFEIVAISHSEFKQSIIASTVHRPQYPVQRDYYCASEVATRHVKIKTQISVLNMLKRLDKIRFRGPKRDEFLDLAESPNASDSECNDDVPVKHRSSIKETEEQRDPAGSGTLAMSAAPIQDYKMSDADRLNEVKGHLEIALLEKHFLRE